MKKIYVKPSMVGLKFESNYGLMEGKSGEASGTDAWAKKQVFEEEKEDSGIPTSFTNIWGDEEEKED